jgi:hypothetical protein
LGEDTIDSIKKTTEPLIDDNNNNNNNNDLSLEVHMKKTANFKHLGMTVKMNTAELRFIIFIADPEAE